MPTGCREGLLPPFFSNFTVLGARQPPALQVSGSLSMRCDNYWCLMEPWTHTRIPARVRGTVGGGWAWFPWQDLVPAGMLEHCCHAPTVAGPAWRASTGTRAECTPIFLLHLLEAAGHVEGPSCHSLTPLPFLQSLNSYTDVNAGCVGWV